MEKSSLQLRLEEQLRQKGRSDYESLCQGILEKRGHLVPGSNVLTPEGEVRDKLGNEGRALDRDGREATYYDSNTNKVYKY